MSLLHTAARASVATRVIGSTHRRQQQRWAAQDGARTAPPPPTQPPVPAGNATMIEQLRQLGELRDSGVLTEEEFDAQKKRVLAAG